MTAIEIQFEEYCDCLLTIELAVKLAQIDRRPINKTIRDSWAVIRNRMECAANIAIFDGLLSALDRFGYQLMSPGWQTAVTLALIAAAMVARVVAQESVK